MTVIVAERLSKVYRLYARPQDRLLHALSPKRVRCSEFKAIDGVSFTARRGEVIGVLGRNGSGKSTLLQLLAGTLRPSAGRAQVHGRIAAILELGAGFNGDFSGLENLQLNARIIGLTEGEIRSRLTAIVEFADIGAFIHQPVRTYSSGMYVRLAFAIAVCVDPDVLLVDEALAVGDVRFQSRCFRRFEELVERGTTVVFVTHSTEQVVRHCTRALLIDDGHLIDDGAPRDVAHHYLERMMASEEGAKPSVPTPTSIMATATSWQTLETRAGYCATEFRWGQGGACLVDAVLRRPGGDHAVVFHSGERLELVVRTRFDRPSPRPIFGMYVKTPDGVTVYGNSTLHLQRGQLAAMAGECREVVFSFSAHLGTGSYLLSLGIAEQDKGGIRPLDRRYDVLHFEIDGAVGAVGIVDLQASCVMEVRMEEAR